MNTADTRANTPKRDILSPKDDFVFRKLFGDQNHADMVVSFLKTFLDLPDEEYDDLRMIDPNLVPDAEDGKSCVLDLKLRTCTGKLINIESQRKNTYELRERIVVYGAKLLAEQLKSSDSYKKTSRVICVLIANFPLFKETAGYHACFHLRTEDGSVRLTDILECHIFELPKIPRDDDGKKVWRWLKFLASATREEFIMLQQTYSELQKPVVHLMELSEDEAFRIRKDAWDKARWDEAAWMRQGRAEGEAIGEAKKQAEIALSMLKEGLPAGMIAKLTGLSPEEIERLPVR